MIKAIPTSVKTGCYIKEGDPSWCCNSYSKMKCPMVENKKMESSVAEVMKIFEIEPSKSTCGGSD